MTEWFAKWPSANIAIAVGAAGLVVLDVDGPEGLASLKAAAGVDDIAELKTRINKTGNGHHLLYKQNGREYKNAAGFLPGLDIRAAGSGIVAPPSVHKNGTIYRIINDADPVDMPDWLLGILEPFERKSHTTAILSHGENGGSGTDDGDPIPDGTRGAVLASLAGSMRARGFTIPEMDAALQEVNSARCKPPKTRAEVSAVAESVGRYEPGDHFFFLTELGNSKRLIAHYGENLRFSFDNNQWLLWDGEIWRPDLDDTVLTWCKEVINGIYDEARNVADKELRAAMAGFALRSQNRRMLVNMAFLAQSDAPIRREKLDTKPWLLAVKNGTLDLKTGELLPFSRADFITKQLPVAYDAAAKCPRWEAFLGEIMGGNLLMVDFLRRACGYSLTGSVEEQCLFILYGTGANGKSTFIDLMLELMSDFGKQTQPETLMLARPGSAGGASPELAELPGVRFLSTVETAENRRLNESLVKQMTGGDRMSARHLFHEFFQFTPEFKLWFASNHLPKIQGTDLAIWRRIRQIPFLVTIPPDDQDRRLPAKLRKEMPGILAWCVRGCLEWQERGLDAPLEVIEATNEYAREMDLLKGFVDDCLEHDEGFPTAKSEVYKTYVSWCVKNGEKPLTSKSLNLKLKERGYSETPGEKSREWKDTAVNPEWMVVD